MRSSRVAGKPQLIRSDMLLPVKSQNTTLFVSTTTMTITQSSHTLVDGDLNRVRSSWRLVSRTRLSILCNAHLVSNVVGHHNTAPSIFYVRWQFIHLHMLVSSRAHSLRSTNSRTHPKAYRVGLTDIVSYTNREDFVRSTHTNAVHKYNGTDANRQPSETKRAQMRERSAHSHEMEILSSTLCGSSRRTHSQCAPTHTWKAMKTPSTEDAQRAREKYKYRLPANKRTEWLTCVCVCVRVTHHTHTSEINVMSQ